MRNYKSLTINLIPYLSLSLLLSLSVSGCDKKSEVTPPCTSFTLNKPFTAKIGETFCLPSDHWEITFGPFLEDSRCNVPGQECFWEGQYVMAVSIDNGEIEKDTFYADGDWRDTLYAGNHSIILNKVFPEVRETMAPLDTSAYSFEIIIK
jgi:hypothetical protein